MDIQACDKLLRTTRSVRKRLDFDKPVEPKVLEECIDIALQAPTGSNMQGWSVVVVTDEDKKKAIADVYKTGFATNKESYDEAVTSLFDTLDELDQRLTDSKYLLGDEITEADLRLIPTVLRFDVVYFTHFKCNWKRIVDYKNLHRYMLDLYSVPAIKDTCQIDHIKRHYYFRHDGINPHRIIPKGPQNFF